MFQAPMQVNGGQPGEMQPDALQLSPMQPNALQPAALQLSPMQRTLWASHRLRPNDPVQNMALLTHLDGVIDADRLSSAFAKVVAASDVLRTRITESGGLPTVSLGSTTANTEFVSVPRDEAESWASARVKAPIDVAAGAYDSVLLQHEDNTSSWYLALHHTVTDATSSSLVFAATSHAYEGTEPAFGSYYEWASQLEGDADKNTAMATEYWDSRAQAQLLGRLYKNVRRPTTTCTRVSTDLDPDLIELARTRFGSEYAMLSQDLAWTTLLLTVASVHLHRCSGAHTFAVGLPVHGRRTPTSRGLLGPVMEVFPVDVTVETDDTFRLLHRRIGRSILSTLRYAVPGTAPTRADYESIVNVISRGEVGKFGDIACVTRWIHSGASEPGHLLSLQATPHGDTDVRLEVDLNHGGIDPGHVNRAPDQILALLRAMLDDPDARVGEVTMLGRREVGALERWGRGAPLSSASPRLLPMLEKALQATNLCVIEDRTTSLTGPQLWDRVTRTAAWLRANDVKRGCRVGVCMVRSVDAVVSILAILLSGGSYVPLEPTHPAKRRRRLADRAQCALVLYELPPPNQLPQPSALIQSDQRRHEDEAYLLFTSGSTGEPKGVPINDLGVENYLAFARDTYLEPEGSTRRRPRLVAPLFSSLNFDLTVTSLFVPLMGGGKLVVIPEDGPVGLQRIADRTDLTWMKATPSHLELLLKLGPLSGGLRTLVVGGEAFATTLANRLQETFESVRILNEYGPTEAVVGCMVYEHTMGLFADEGSVPVGIPAPGVGLRIVDQYQNLAPLGSIGELCISHDGLTAGYLVSGTNGADAEDSAFFEQEGRRFYRSGDMVRLIDDDTLTYLGRIDDQVKIGGIRLEPSEVERELSEHEAIARSVVRVWNQQPGVGSRDQLTAWIEVRDGHRHPTPAQLRSFLSTRLPRYSVPTAYVLTDALALTDNGKLDESGLRAPTRADMSAESTYVGPTSELETSIAVAYAQVLGIEGVAMGDDFFDLGGDSLAALEMVAILGSLLGVVLREELAFSHTCPAELAEAIVSGDATNESAPPSGPVRRQTDAPPPLSDGETALLFEHLSDPTSTRYNVSRSYVIHGPVDSRRFVEAVRRTVTNHVPLTWSFGEQRVHLATGEALDVIVLPAPVTTTQLSRDAEQQHARPFDLESGPLVRLLLAPIDDGTTAVTLSFHHISIDAVSFDRMWEEIDGRYRGVEPREHEYDYSDHAEWQRVRDRSSAAAFWMSPSNCRQSANLQLGTPGLDELGDRVADRYIEIPASFSAAELASGPGATPFATVLAALASTLRRRADGDTIAISVTASTREHPGAGSLVGYYLNTLPLLVDVAPEETLLLVAQRCTAVLGAALEHRSYPYADLVAERRRAGVTSPNMSVLLAFQHLEPSSFNGSACEHTILASNAAVTDATLFVQVRGQHLDLGIEYSGDVLDERLAALLLRDLDSVVRDSIESRDLTVDKLDLGSVVGPVHGPRPTFDTEKPLIDTIVDHFASRPDATAIRFARTSVTYRELGARSYELAMRLKAAGAGPGRFVAVEAVRHSDTIVAILAILRVGAAYVPIDPDYPADHVDHIFADADVNLLVTAAGADSRLDRDSVRVIGVEPLVPDAAPSAVPVEFGASRNDPAYVIYTSGSTGRPKGVVVSHAGLTHSTVARNQVYDDAVDRFLLLSSFAFDSSMVGLFWTLYDGGTVIVPEPGAHLDVWALGDLIEAEKATHILAIPSFYRLLVSEVEPDRLKSLRTVIVAGEPCHAEIANAHRRAGIEAGLYNEYGPTEATVWSHFHRVDTTKTAGVVPIGKPLPGITTIVVDQNNQPLPSGVPGELLISGPTVTNGYLNADDLTAERYVHLRTTPSVDPETRWYRTGDVVESHTDGELVFKGRLDDQVKVRGFRVELSEVESVALSIDGVHTAIAGLTNRGGRDSGQEVAQLALWYLDRGSLDSGEIRDRMRASLRLADHSVPVLYKRIESVPLTANGKIDRQSLPDPEAPTATSRAAEPEAGSDEELALAAVWAEVLQLEHVGIEDNFFDLGGDSIVSIQVVARLRKLGYHLTPRDVFTHQNVRELASVVSRLGHIDAEQGPVTGDIALTPIQHWFFSQELANANHWNQSLWLRLGGDTDLETLEEAAAHLGTQHDALRLRFERSPQGWTQSHLEQARPVAFTRHGGPDSVPASPETRARLAAEADDSLDVETGDLMAVVVLVSANTLDLYVTIHHLVMDTVSWSPLLEDWATAYGQIRNGHDVSFEAKTSSFKAWSHQLQEMAARPATAAYWIEQPEPSSDVDVADNVQGVAHRVSASTSRLVSDALISGRRAQNVLLTAAAVALGEITGRNKLDVMLEGHGREDDLFEGVDLSRTVGWFTTRYPVRVPTSDAAGPEGVLGLVNNMLDQIPDRGIGYGVAREVAAITELTSRPEPQIAFNYLGQLDRSLAVNMPFVEAGALFGPVGASNRRAHALGIIAYVQSRRLTVEVEYVESHTDKRTAESLAQNIVDIVGRLVESNAAAPQTKFELAGLDESQLFDLSNLLDKLDADTS